MLSCEYVLPTARSSASLHLTSRRLLLHSPCTSLHLTSRHCCGTPHAQVRDRELSISFLHHQAVQRRVRNPFESSGEAGLPRVKKHYTLRAASLCQM